MKRRFIANSVSLFLICSSGCDGTIIPGLCSVPSDGDLTGEDVESQGCPTVRRVSKWTAQAAPEFEFPPETELLAKPQRMWKKDPHYISTNGTNYLFISGSNSYTNRTQWSISAYSDTSELTARSNWRLLLEGRASPSWDRADLMAPFAVPQADGSWVMYYAASGDPSKPDYVLQVGRASSRDMVNWTREDRPLVAASEFRDGIPIEQRPDAFGATDPCLLVDGSDVHLYYAGLHCSDGNCKFQILRSTSKDGGATFSPGEVVLSGRPENPEEAGGVAGPTIAKLKEEYVLLYTAVREVPQKQLLSIRHALTTGTVGIATSSDGKHFLPNKPDGSPLLSRLAGASSYRSEGVFSPSLVEESGRLRAWVAGLKEDGNGVYYGVVSATLSRVWQRPPSSSIGK